MQFFSVISAALLAAGAIAAPTPPGPGGAHDHGTEASGLGSFTPPGNATGTVPALPKPSGAAGGLGGLLGGLGSGPSLPKPSGAAGGLGGLLGGLGGAGAPELPEFELPEIDIGQILEFMDNVRKFMESLPKPEGGASGGLGGLLGGLGGAAPSGLPSPSGGLGGLLGGLGGAAPSAPSGGLLGGLAPPAPSASAEASSPIAPVSPTAAPSAAPTAAAAEPEEAGHSH